MIDMEMRNRRIQVFEDTLRFCERERKLVDSIAMSREHTMLWRNLQEKGKDEFFAENKLFDGKRYDVPCKVECSERRALDLAEFLKKENHACRVGVLALSLSMYFGGDVLRGGTGWEETLCKCTTLYPCLEKEHISNACYELHSESTRQQSGEVCIYVPGVVCIRSDEDVCERLQDKNWFTMDIIAYTSAGIREFVSKYNQGDSVEISQSMLQEYEKEQYRSLEVMLRMAAEHNLEELVIPISQYMSDGCVHQDIIEQMKTALQKYSYFFRAVHLVFA